MQKARGVHNPAGAESIFEGIRAKADGAKKCRIGVVQPAVFAQAVRSESTMKSRVIGTASRLVDSSI